MGVSVIVPAGVLPDVVRRIGTACAGLDAELLLARHTPSTDGTVDEGPGDAGPAAGLPVRFVDGTLSDALAASRSTYCVVLEGGPECRPELIPALTARLAGGDVDLAAVTRYGGTSDPGGRPARSGGGPRSGITRLACALFPGRLTGSTDPVSGFFALRPGVLGADPLRPRNTGLQLEILLRHRVRVGEIASRTGREAAAQPGGFRQDLRALVQLAELRVGRAGLFAAVGGIGTILNLLIMAALLALGVHYVTAALVAAAVTILTNFFLQEKLVFAGDTGAAQALRHRFVQSVGFNSIEAMLRMPFLLLLVEVLLVHSVVAQAGTLAAAFVVRYLFHAKVVYRRRPPVVIPSPALDPAET